MYGLAIVIFICIRRQCTFDSYQLRDILYRTKRFTISLSALGTKSVVFMVL